MDNGKVTEFTLIDRSAAFDTISHTIIVDRLSVWCGKPGVVVIVLNLTLLVDTIIILKLGIVSHHHFIFHVMFLWVQFWDRCFYTVHNFIELCY